MADFFDIRGFSRRVATLVVGTLTIGTALILGSGSTVTGDLIPTTDATYKVGTTSTRWLDGNFSRNLSSLGVFSGNSVDPTYAGIPAKNQFYDIATATIGSYYDQVLIAGQAFFGSNNPTMSFNGLEVAALTDGSSTTTLSQLNGMLNNTVHNGSGHVGEIHGGTYSAHNDGSGTVTSTYGGRFVYANTGAGSMTNAYGIQIESPQNDGSNANITNAYGVYIENQNKGTNKWQLYSSATTTPSYFGGLVGIATTATQPLEVVGMTSTTNLTVNGTGEFMTLASSTRFYASDGTVGAPAYAFGANPNSGLFNNAGLPVLASGGVTRMTFAGSGNITTVNLIPSSAGTLAVGTSATGFKDAFFTGTVTSTRFETPGGDFFYSASGTILTANGPTAGSGNTAFLFQTQNNVTTGNVFRIVDGGSNLLNVNGAGLNTMPSALITGTLTSSNSFSALNSTTTGGVYMTGLSAAGAGLSAVCIDANGQAFKDASGLCNVSGLQFKENVESLPNEGITKIMSMDPTSYTLKVNGQKRVGLIADDLESIDPRVVNYEADGKTVHSYDTFGVIGWVVKALQETIEKVTGMQTEIDEQRKEIDQQRREIDELRLIILNLDR